MSAAVPTLLAAGLSLGLLAAAQTDRAPRLVWNASASVPIGFYAVQALDTPIVGDLVVLEPPPPLGDWLLEHGYLGADVPLIKHIAALPGQRVCRVGVTVSLDGAPDPRVGLGKDGQYDGNTDAGKLGNLTGAQSFTVPAGVDVSDFNEVYIWCEKFSVPLGVATLG